jgi:hypothetical protein
MKLTTKILVAFLILLTSGLFASNFALKKIYDRTDKSDVYWTYGKILEQPFHHLKIEGGNISNIAYEQSKTFSVRVLKEWYGYETGAVKAFIKNDTLFVDFPASYQHIYEKEYFKWNTFVRIFSPGLLSVTGHNTKFGMFKMKQGSLSVNLSGKSQFELESLVPSFDSLHVVQGDSSEVVFEMDPNVKGSHNFHINFLQAQLHDHSMLDVGFAQVDSLKLSVEDSAAVLLSGGAIRKSKEYKFIQQANK